MLKKDRRRRELRMELHAALEALCQQYKGDDPVVLAVVRVSKEKQRHG
jgi:hypothetical protein